MLISCKIFEQSIAYRAGMKANQTKQATNHRSMHDASIYLVSSASIPQESFSNPRTVHSTVGPRVNWRTIRRTYLRARTSRKMKGSTLAVACSLSFFLSSPKPATVNHVVRMYIYTSGSRDKSGKSEWKISPQKFAAKFRESGRSDRCGCGLFSVEECKCAREFGWLYTA